jgi:hypothetical protein
MPLLNSTTAGLSNNQPVLAQDLWPTSKYSRVAVESSFERVRDAARVRSDESRQAKYRRRMTKSVSRTCSDSRCACYVCRCECFVSWCGEISSDMCVLVARARFGVPVRVYFLAGADEILPVRGNSLPVRGKTFACGRQDDGRELTCVRYGLRFDARGLGSPARRTRRRAAVLTWPAI